MTTIDEVIAMLEETMQIFEEEQYEDVRQSLADSLASLQIVLMRAKAIRAKHEVSDD